jgi:hypothetical protein
LEAKYELIIFAPDSQVKPITRCIRPNKVEQNLRDHPQVGVDSKAKDVSLNDDTEPYLQV